METARANRVHIGIFGGVNAGKSTILNRITNQDVALVSEEEGTTTDPVYKNMEVKGIGAVTFVDTAGFFDGSSLGKRREERTRGVLDECDAFLLVFRKEEELPILEEMRKREKPIIAVENGPLSREFKEGLSGIPFVPPEREEILDTLRTCLSPERDSLCSGMVKRGDVVFLVMPQDEQAPTGRLILPQVQTLRSLLDLGAVTLCVQPEELDGALERFPAPKWIITDSQVFREVYEKKPRETKLTSFSVLFAGEKGDKGEFLKGAKVVRTLPEDAKILLLEACTHAPGHEDIGRVKIPRLLKKVLPKVEVSHIQGKDFPDNPGDYHLIVLCGSCMQTRTLVMSRIRRAREAGVPVTNYGMLIAELTGILEYVDM